MHVRTTTTVVVVVVSLLYTVVLLLSAADGRDRISRTSLLALVSVPHAKNAVAVWYCLYVI